MADITSIAPYEAVTINDTTDENRTDLVALLQRQENEIALQNQVIRQILQHWDSISHICKIGSDATLAEVGATVAANQHIAISATSAFGNSVLATEVTKRRLVLYDITNGTEIMSWSADQVIGG